MMPFLASPPLTLVDYGVCVIWALGNSNLERQGHVARAMVCKKFSVYILKCVANVRKLPH
jgi:hypothetical protein